MAVARLVTLALIGVTLTSCTVYQKVCGDHWCTCDREKRAAVCQDHGKNLMYIPALPLYVTTIEFSGNHLPIVSSNTFKNISSLNLTDIKLTNNRISRVDSDSFSVFSHLKNLVLSGNMFVSQSLSDMLKNLSSIPVTNLSLDRCNINGGSSMFKHLRSSTLKLLSLDKNHLNFYNHSDFSGFPLLNTLSMGHNSVRNVELSFSRNMKTLNLRDNYISKFPNFCSGNNSYFPNLKKIKLDHNSLLEIDGKSLKCLRNLELFSISANRLMAINSNTFSGLPNLHNVIVRNIDGRGVLIHSHAFSNNNVKYISLTSSSIHFKTKVHRDAFRGCNNIDSLDVSFNVFYNSTNEDLENWFGHLTSLTGLGLGQGHLKIYPSFIQRDLINLQYLKLYGNLLERLPDNAFESLKNLTHLWLSDNRFADIQENAFPYEVRQRLRVVCISNNPFACTCDLLWFINWIKQEHRKFQGYPTRYMCNSPQQLKGKTLQEVKLTKALCLMPQPVSLAIIVASVIALLVLVCWSLVYRWRWHIRYYLYQRRNKHGQFKRLESADIIYDAYVIYSFKDIKWIKEELMENTESPPDAFRLYVRDRDSLAGDPITDNVVNNMAASRCILVLLSNSMARDEQCEFELMFVQGHEGLREHGLPIVVVLLEEIQSHNVTRTVYALVKMHSYICWGDEPHARQPFWERLMFSMRPLQPTLGTENAAGDNKRLK